MTALQLQPQGGTPEAWIAAAEKAGATFELADLFSPAALLGRGDPGIVEDYRRSGLITSAHGAFIDVNPASADPELRRISRLRYRESCDKALALGAGNLVFHSTAFPFLRGVYLENWAAVCGEFLQELAGAYPLGIFVENAQDLDPEPLRLLMDRITEPRIGVCLDVGHANYSRAPLEEWFDTLGDRIGYLHLSDNLGRFDDHIPLGQGTIPWQLVNDRWKGLGRDIPITLETGSLVSTEQSLAYLYDHQYFGLRGRSHG